MYDVAKLKRNVFQTFGAAIALSLAGCGGSEGASSGGTQAVAIPSSVGSEGSIGSGSSPTPVLLDAMTLTADPAATTVLANADIAARTEPYLAGVGTHFALEESRGYELTGANRAIGSLGSNSYRDEVYWAAFAPSWDLYGSHVPARVANFMRSNSGRPLIVLNNGNPYIPGTQPPVTDATRQLFADFALRAVRTINRSDAIYEIWNEYNMRGAGYGGQPRLNGAGDGVDVRSASYYAALAQKTVDVVKAASPSARIVVGAVGDDPDWLWSRAVIATGIMRKADGFSAHIYNHCNNEPIRGATETIQRLENFQRIATAANGGVQVPLYLTEMGWPTGNATCSTEPVAAADYTAQLMLYAASKPWVKGSWIYELRNSGPDRTNLEDNFGLFNEDYSEKPSACRVREAIAFIQGVQAMAVENPADDVFIVKARTATGVRAVVWTGHDTVTANIVVGGSATFQARKMCGADATPAGSRRMTFSRQPVVIDIPSVTAAAFQIKR